MKITMTITLPEDEAQALWEAYCQDDDNAPEGQDLANWLAELCETTIESNFSYDAGVVPEVEAVVSDSMQGRVG